MIYTVTLNPAVDYVVGLDEIRLGEVNRTFGEQIFFGGKGINVSIVLRRLGIKSTALGFIAGFTGNALKNQLMLEGVSSDFLQVDGFTRINVKIRSKLETELNGSGPFIDEQSLLSLIKQLQNLNNEDWLILSGSLPKCLKKDTYKRILDAVKHSGVKTVVDTSGEALLEAIKASCDYIKPNISELSEILNKKLDTTKSVIEAAKNIQKFGAKNVIVSMGKYGAVFVDQKGGVITEEAPVINPVNTVGSGDSLLAGFISGFISTNNPRTALKLGVAAGSATAASEGLASKSAIMEIFSDKNKSM